MFEVVGLFDESIFMYGKEDDIHYRLMQRFGTHFIYDKNIRYLHLSSERKPNADYEMKFLKVALVQNAKKGYSQAKIIRNLYRLYRTLYWRELIKVMFGKDKERLEMLKEMLKRIKQLNTNNH